MSNIQFDVAAYGNCPGARWIVAARSRSRTHREDLQKLVRHRTTSNLPLATLLSLLVIAAGCSSDSRPKPDAIEKAPAIDVQQGALEKPLDSNAEIESDAPGSGEARSTSLRSAGKEALKKAVKDSQGEAKSEASVAARDRHDAILEAERAAELSERRVVEDPQSPHAQSDSALAHARLGNLLALRNGPGDRERAIGLQARSLEHCELLLKAHPDSPREVGNVALSLRSLGDLLAKRRRPGDVDQAIRHYTRSAEYSELLLKANADSIEATRDVCAIVTALGDLLAQRGLMGDAERAYKYYLRDLELCESQLRAHPDSAMALRDLSSSLNSLGRFVSKRGLPGDHELALQYYTCSLSGYESLLEANPESPREAWEVAAVLQGLGKHHSARYRTGDWDQALKFLVRSAEMRESVLKANPQSIEAAGQVAYGADALGEFYYWRNEPGDIDRAVQHYALAVERFESLVEAAPEAGNPIHGLMGSVLRLTAALRFRGQPGDDDLAIRHLTRSVELTESQLHVPPESAVSARDVSTLLTTLGNFMTSRGQPEDAEEASRCYSRAIEVLEAPLKANPGSDQAAHEVYESIYAVADFLSLRQQPGDVEQATRFYTRSTEILEAAWKAHPDSSETARDVAGSLGQLGNILAKRNLPGDTDQALRHYSHGLEISEGLQKASPDSVRATEDLVVSLNMLGNFLVQRGQSGDAESGVRYCTRALELCETQLRATPDSIRAARDMAVTRRILVRLYTSLGDAESALRHRRACYELLKPRIGSGIRFDPPIHTTYEELRQEFESEQKSSG